MISDNKLTLFWDTYCSVLPITNFNWDVINAEEKNSYEFLTTKYEEKSSIININVDIIINRSSLKKIIIGRHGSMLKEIGTRARVDLENTLGKQIYLELYVKTIENWRNQERYLKEFGIIDD